MTSCVRRFRLIARSIPLRALALLAWLLLEVMPAYGMNSPGSMKAMPHQQAAPAAMAHVMPHCHGHVSNAANSCCGNHGGCCSGHACGCVIGCAGAVTVPGQNRLASLRLATVRWMTLDISIADTDFIPPLRPPIA